MFVTACFWYCFGWSFKLLGSWLVPLRQYSLSKSPLSNRHKHRVSNKNPQNTTLFFISSHQGCFWAFFDVKIPILFPPRSWSSPSRDIAQNKGQQCSRPGPSNRRFEFDRDGVVYDPGPGGYQYCRGAGGRACLFMGGLVWFCVFYIILYRYHIYILYTCIQLYIYSILYTIYIIIYLYICKVMSNVYNYNKRPAWPFNSRVLSANRFDFGMGCAEATGLGFDFGLWDAVLQKRLAWDLIGLFFVINPRVLAANRVDFGLFLFHKCLFPPSSLKTKPTLSTQAAWASPLPPWSFLLASGGGVICFHIYV